MIKCPLKKVLKQHDMIQPIIETYVRDINQIVMLGYQFIKYYVFDHYQKYSTVPIINHEWILNVLKTVSVKHDNRGRHCFDDTNTSKNEMNVFYENTFSKIMKMERPSYYHKTLVLKEQSKQMFTCEHLFTDKSKN